MSRRLRSCLRWLALGLLASSLSACSEPDTEFRMPPVVTPNYTETGDFEDIQRHGTLRLLVARDHSTVDGLPSEPSPVYRQIQAATEFARTFGLRPVIVLIDHPGSLITALEEGRGDLVVNNITITDDYREQADFTVALERTQQMLVARADDPIRAPEDMAGRTITVESGSRFLSTARNLQDAWPDLLVDSLPGLSPQRKVELLATEQIDLTILESNVLENLLDQRSDIRTVFPVSPESGAGWAIRQNSPQLRTVLNRFIARHELAALERDRHTEDLHSIIEYGTLRMATTNSGTNYFLWRGQLLGFEYELAQELARRLGVRLEVVVADDNAATLEKVANGEADFAGAFLTEADGAQVEGITWSRPYHEAKLQIVAHEREREVESVEDLHGRIIHAQQGTRHWRALESLRDETGIEFELRPVPAGQGVEQSMTRVSQGHYALTIADEQTVRNAMIGHENIKSVLDLEEPVDHRWAVRADNPDMLEAVDAFLRSAYRSTLYNVLYSKYFRDKERIAGFHAQRADLDGGLELSPWDDIIRRHAEAHNIDWRLAVALMFEESGFNPQAQSWVGAIGLMQIMPRTAGQLEVEGDILDPEINIEAGLRYLAWLHERFEDTLRVQDRTWFALAAYNAGIGHVRDARRLAAELGLDPNRWFDNVEVAMLKLSQREYFQHARFGYVRGQEPVNYVSSIRNRYMAYLMWTDDCWPHCSESPHPRTPASALRSSMH